MKGLTCAIGPGAHSPHASTAFLRRTQGPHTRACPEVLLKNHRDSRLVSMLNNRILQREFDKRAGEETLDWASALQQTRQI